MRSVRSLFTVAAVLGLAATSAAEAAPRQEIRIVGSSTMFNITSEVAEQFGIRKQHPSPVVESTGTGGGFKQFCQGIGDSTPDIVTASRQMTDAEKDLCARNDVGTVLEFPVGQGGLVIINAREKGPLFNLTRDHLWKALAARLPVQGKIQANPYHSWHEIDPILPDLPILVYGPPPTSGTRDALVGMVIEPSCLANDSIQSIPEADRLPLCMKLREDGAYVDAGENDDTLLRRTSANPKAVAVIGFHALGDDPTLKAAPIEGVQPSAVSLMSNSYPLMRDLYVYVKKDHLPRVPGLADFVRLYLSEDMIGPGGRLQDDGLVPLPAKQRQDSQKAAENL